MRPWRWRIHMSARPHAVRSVELVDTLGQRHRVTHATNASTASHATSRERSAAAGASFRVRACACDGAAAAGCSALVEGLLEWREQPVRCGDSSRLSPFRGWL